MFGQYLNVTVVRVSGTDESQREDVRVGGNLDDKLLFHTGTDIKRGDEIHSSVLDEPRVVVAIHPKMAQGKLTHYEADLLPKSQTSEAQSDVPHSAPSLSPLQQTPYPYDPDELTRLQYTLLRVNDLPPRILDTYAMLWQLETWLRHMVYAELKTLLGQQWEVALPSHSQKTSERSRDIDKRMTHMPTPETSRLSYVQLAHLCTVIETHWNLFESYLPPQTLWKAKMEEVGQIRHRVAHFRYGHTDDPTRLRQVLRDLDQGMWRFCTSFNDLRPVLPPTSDPVTNEFSHLDPFPYCETSARHWCRVGIADPRATFMVQVERISRPWQPTIQGPQSVTSLGFLYHVSFAARDRRKIDHREFLARTRDVHDDVVFVCLGNSTVDLKIPAVLGYDRVIAMIKRCVDILPTTITPSGTRDEDSKVLQHLADQWPEHVIGPFNPLTFLDPSMKCSFFAA